MRGELSLLLATGLWLLAQPVLGQSVQVRSASPVAMPAPVDSNSPAYWRDGEFNLITSTGSPLISRSWDQFSPYETEQIVVDHREHFPMWIEATWADVDGTLYGWYHHEAGGLCPGSTLTAPRIGAVVSYDGGRTFYDKGIILASGDPVDCSAKNGFFAGGHGDFSVIVDRERTYFYFLFGNYGGDVGGQGVAVARLAFEDRDNPVGAVRKYFDGAWDEPGLGGRVTPVFPAAVSWQRADTNSFWGPSVHWNTHLGIYVVLLNHACCMPNWPQEGIYVSFNADLSNPGGWTTPEVLLRDIGYAPGYYPQVLGTGPEDTDTVVGETARLYVQGLSKWQITFHKAEAVEPVPEEPAEPQEPGPDEPPG